jgi:hypothetical protein
LLRAQWQLNSRNILYDETLSMIQIRYEPDDVVVTIPKNQAASGYIQAFLERARIDALLAASEADEDAIRHLADAVDAGWWAENRDRFLAGTSTVERPE